MLAVVDEGEVKGTSAREVGDGDGVRERQNKLDKLKWKVCECLSLEREDVINDLSWEVVPCGRRGHRRRESVDDELVRPTSARDLLLDQAPGPVAISGTDVCDDLPSQY